jgi:hypothetical protein
VDGYVVDGKAAGLSHRIAEKIKDFFRLPNDVRREMRIVAAEKASKFTIQGNAREVINVVQKNG